jgi:hypothetical protein
MPSQIKHIARGLSKKMASPPNPTFKNKQPISKSGERKNEYIN